MEADAESSAASARGRAGRVDDVRQRRIDTELIFASVHATAAWEAESGRSAVIKPLRELLWFVWEHPRLPRPLYRSKYPLSVPWTPAARAQYRAHRARLVIEHVTPASVLVRRLIAKPPATHAALVRTLRTIEYVVVTPEDNQRLTAAGVGSKLAPGSKDPWDRYTHAGLDPSTFRPVETG